VIVVFESFNPARLSQEAATSGVVASIGATASAVQNKSRLVMWVIIGRILLLPTNRIASEP
jgi:hypothetical protein